jgi:hypothetical protein
MVGLSRLIVAFAVVGLFAQHLYADVIPSRRAADTGDSSQKIQTRLVELGLTADAAKDQVQKLNVEQTKYFAANVDRIQLTGQGENWGGQSDNLWWEWLFGIAVLLVVGAVLVIVARG